jgi:hypothetical protein
MHATLRDATDCSPGAVEKAFATKLLSRSQSFWQAARPCGAIPQAIGSELSAPA